jgi:hypothetical protein
MSTQLANPSYHEDLGHGLIRRWSTAADVEKIGHLFAVVHRDSPDAPLSARVADVARVLMSDDFPRMDATDFAVIENTSKPERPLVAATCLWRLQWSYGGIRFGVGQPEMVVTHAEYRNRGLVRAMFEMVHARSAEEGHLVQAITGIPYFYRQFGYEYVLDLEGQRFVAAAAIPAKSGDDPEPYTLRLATLADVAELATLYHQARSASLVWHEADEHFWRHTIASWDDPVVQQQGVTGTCLQGRPYLIVDRAGRTVGYTWPAAKRWSRNLAVALLQLAPQINWQAAMPAVLRALRTLGEQTPAVNADTPPFSEIVFQLGRSHPLYDVLGETLAPRADPPYAWYLRVPDVPAFIRQIAPVLEQRLAASILTGYSGELQIDHYRGGLRLQVEQGKLVAVEAWRPPPYGDSAQAGCPPLVFLQLLFCYRSLAELRAWYPDVWANPEAALLLNLLFPKQPSTVYPLMNT